MRAELISPQSALPIRRRILRPEVIGDDGLVYDEDLAATTATYGCFVEGVLVSVGTIMKAPHPHTPQPDDWRIRGMATDEPFRNRGCGALILHGLLEHARRHGARRVWCNARVDAIRFYERAGFVRRGDAFMTAGGRPHVLMDSGLTMTHADR